MLLVCVDCVVTVGLVVGPVYVADIDLVVARVAGSIKM